MTIKDYIIQQLEQGATVTEAWRSAEIDRWHVSWNYVVRIAREWRREQEKVGVE